jgi:hypothetical protein
MIQQIERNKAGNPNMFSKTDTRTRNNYKETHCLLVLGGIEANDGITEEVLITLHVLMVVDERKIHCFCLFRMRFYSFLFFLLSSSKLAARCYLI